MTDQDTKDPSWTKEDRAFEKTLRPESLAHFLGQKEIHDRLEVFIGAAKKRGEVLGHSLFWGPPGLGKTTLAHIISKEMQSNLITTSGPAIDKAGDLAGLLTNLQEGDVLFIDEIHRLNRAIEEYLYSAMEDFTLDIMLDSGPHARSVQVKLPPFTLVGATTRVGLISSPLRTRFGFTCRLNYYPIDVLTKILIRSANILQISLDPISAEEIAKRARGTPRIANNLLRWVRDYAQMKTEGIIESQGAIAALKLLSIDAKGLDEMDKKILQTIIEHHEGGPVGLQTLAAAIGEEPHTLSEVYEPFLIMEGLLRRTPRGREATHLAYQHLKQGERE